MSAEPSLAETMAEVLDGLGPIAEAGAGYRAQLEEVGFSPTVAEQVAADFICLLHRAVFPSS